MRTIIIALPAVSVTSQGIFPSSYNTLYSVILAKVLHSYLLILLVSLGALGVTCSPRDPRFADSNPAEVDGFFSGRKIPEHKSSVRDFKLGVGILRFQAR